MKRKIINVRLRLRPELHKMLVDGARKNNQSQNREIARRLEDSFRREEIETIIKNTIEATCLKIIGY